MVVVRLLALFALVVLAVSGALYLFTRNRRYLDVFWLTLKASLVLLLAVLLLLALDRVLP
ncbi:MAG TPA: hypothetical protein VLA73_02495 [Burkholderiales bacterium]|nr:hypothetical protein [Burkholderiales bacterium]